MKKELTILLLIASAFLIVDSFSLWRIFLEFFFIGIIPGTTERIDPKSMMMLISIATGMTIGRIIAKPYSKRLSLIANR